LDRRFGTRGFVPRLPLSLGLPCDQSAEAGGGSNFLNVGNISALVALYLLRQTKVVPI
jgi:hypothetical protein